MEAWFKSIPEGKKPDIERRFRSHDDRQHAGALLEMATHEVLQAVGSNVQGDPKLGSGYPDFCAMYKGKKVFVECTIAQSSDRDIANTRRENDIKEIIDSIDTGDFKLGFHVLESGPDAPPTRQLRKALVKWISSLNRQEESERFHQGHNPQSLLWQKYGWELSFTALPFDAPGENRAIVSDVGQAQDVLDQARIKSAIEGKAKKYKSLFGYPYVIVAGSGMAFSRERHLWEMIARDKLVLVERSNLCHSHLTSLREPEPSGLFGPWTGPRNRQVSAILFKSRFRNVWDIANQSGSNSTVRPWLLVHHPEANNPLPHGMFPFAIEYVSCTRDDMKRGLSSFPKEYQLNFGTLRRIDPVCTVNDLLGLPDPWPGEEE